MNKDKTSQRFSAGISSIDLLKNKADATQEVFNLANRDGNHESFVTSIDYFKTTSSNHTKTGETNRDPQIEGWL